ncbi:hypothetical protein E0H22_22690 [Rhodopseudomonas boonkerdii]|uniref:hypothetical protein n=1 Tax=Rhodopseudomonas boonkerdii TaxID=475937 RepID=UPI001E56A808|nr:hypothetical protein [Rhodopseudomonas boonkerdii]UGV28239.1 hypothetical protein E0H22_22690 [Rhodopseudomonas boonkerdii]
MIILDSRPIAVGRIVLAGFMLALSGSAASADPAAFAGLAGAWSGAGTISLSDGANERIRCKATYVVGRGDARLQQSLRCASDSYRFDLTSDVISQQGQIAGSWSETSRGISGTLVGRENGGSITAVVDAPGFSAQLSLKTSGNRQNFSLSSEGDIRNVSIVMSRR